jgi:hypothetical protein
MLRLAAATLGFETTIPVGSGLFGPDGSRSEHANAPTQSEQIRDETAKRDINASARCRA